MTEHAIAAAEVTAGPPARTRPPVGERFVG